MADKIKLVAGCSYINRRGDIIKNIISLPPDHKYNTFYKFQSAAVTLYSENGELYPDAESSLDLIEMVKDETQKMNVASTGGLRDNKNKYRLSLVPSELEEAVAEVIWLSSDKAGGKYPMHNWRKGLPWSEVAESAIRHLKKFAQKGEDFDKESGLHHLKHAACNIAFLLEYLSTHPEMDDRYKGDKK